MERYTRLPLVPREAPPAWRATWRYRVVALVLLAVVALVVAQVVQRLSGTAGQDPGIGGPVPTRTAPPAG